MPSARGVLGQRGPLSVRGRGGCQGGSSGLCTMTRGAQVSQVSPWVVPARVRSGHRGPRRESRGRGFVLILEAPRDRGAIQGFIGPYKINKIIQSACKDVN